MMPKDAYRVSGAARRVSILLAVLFVLAVYSGVLRIEYIPTKGAALELQRNVYFVTVTAVTLIVIPVLIDRVLWGLRKRKAP
jgi:heme/copper-type cytochrome/quinol oxidase subunit 2